MKIEYILSFTRDGVPIHSSCYGSFCANMGYDKNLLAGFISALSSMPSAVGHDDNVKAVEMGFTKIYFNHTDPSEHIICLGIIKSTIEDPTTQKRIDKIFSGVEKVLEEDFAGHSWVMFTDEEKHRLEETIIHEVIEPVLNSFKDNDVCDHNGCPFDMIADHQHVSDGSYEPRPVWDKVKQVYNEARVSLIKRILAPIVIPVFRFFDIRGYNRREKAQNMK